MKLFSYHSFVYLRHYHGTQLHTNTLFKSIFRTPSFICVFNKLIINIRIYIKLDITINIIVDSTLDIKINIKVNIILDTIIDIKLDITLYIK